MAFPGNSVNLKSAQTHRATTAEDHPNRTADTTRFPEFTKKTSKKYTYRRENRDEAHTLSLVSSRFRRHTRDTRCCHLARNC
ncbi:hypothetical protein WN55_06987 [Dufourea novaeangliae]|uniref:Uncharacterized protein n=1 Tax=Dufourea novaeangliae TaxID=178035 RepID=A0A154P2D9_DUFNO|nr:hypothetical protein WN55_06987 [Dufourea novaeangliae]